MSTIKSVAEQTAAGAQSVSAASQEQLASMEEITGNAASLARMAEQLESLVKTFAL